MGVALSRFLSSPAVTTANLIWHQMFLVHDDQAAASDAPKEVATLTVFTLLQDPHQTFSRFFSLYSFRAPKLVSSIHHTKMGDILNASKSTINAMLVMT